MAFWRKPTYQTFEPPISFCRYLIDQTTRRYIVFCGKDTIVAEAEHFQDAIRLHRKHGGIRIFCTELGRTVWSEQSDFVPPIRLLEAEVKDENELVSIIAEYNVRYKKF